MAPTSDATMQTSADQLDKAELLAALRQFQRGDFSARLPDRMTGLDGEICTVFNEIAQHAEGLVEEIGEVREEVGVKGRTERRVRGNGSSGDWSRLVFSVNETIDDLTSHSDEIARVVTAVAKGDLTQTVDIDHAETHLQGDFLRHARAVNGMVEQLATFGSEVTRVAQEVGMEGKLGAQANVPGVSGAWKELTDSVNLMASNLTAQVREIARVTTAVAQGDLTKTVNMEVKGEILELKNTINTMVDQLGSFADEVTRVAREVGSEGILGGQARVRGVSGVWKELTDNVNLMASNLTSQVRNIAEVSTAIAEGDLSKKITVEVKGEMLELKNTINKMVDQLSSFADEVTRVSREVGTEGKLGGQAEVSGVSGVWRELTENVNSMALNLTNQVRNIAEVITAIAEGDLSKKITVDARGEIQALKNTINDTVDKLNHFSAEVTRVARLVGTEGTLGVQAEVKGVSGIWKELTDNVNTMGRNLTDQVRDIAEVTTAVANGDLSKKITVEVRGEILQLKNTINAMVDSLSSFADEVNRMAREVGTEGVLGGQAQVHDVSGIWKELTDNVNSMASNLTNQVRNIAEVATAVASGDLSKKITVDARGEVQDLKETINNMVDQLNAFGAEVTRVAREVGVEGKLGGQAEVEGVRGIWKELTDNVNLMASNLTNQVRDIAGVTTAVANGDLTRKITVEARGEILELKNTVNTMVDQLSSFAAEVTRLASEVGVEGKLGGQADVRGVSGTWRDLTDAVNSMATNLTDQVRNISQVASAIAEGDLRKKIVVDARGEILELKNTINTMVDQLNSFAEEVTRVAREVGTEGKLGGQAEVEGARGIWKELTDNVNLMGSNLTAQVRDISQVATAIAQGDLGRKITVEVRGELLELKNTINGMVDQLSSFADEVTRVARDVGVEGKLGGQAEVRGASGIWKELTDNVNMMASNLTDQVRDIARVTTAVANGDLSQKITVEVKGEIQQLKNTINTMVDQLSSFADEVTRVSREVGLEGELGGQAEVRGVSGTWRELTDNVNVMARNLTEQVRGIARIVTAVANGDLKQQLQLDAKGEIYALVQTINDMIVTLSTFADQVSGVARDVGVEGKLGGQADVPGAAGIWRDLTNNVNELAGNLTRQVRAIGDVATAVTKGDLTRTIDVEARGEVAELKDNINQMIRTLAETTRVNEEQDWLKTNLTRFTRMLQGQRDLMTVARQVLDELAQTVEAQHGAFYMMQTDEDDEPILKLFASYAFNRRKHLANEYRLGESMVGQAALEKRRILISNVPGDYVVIGSALGEAAPLNIVVVPVLFEGDVKGVIEMASFEDFTAIQIAFIDQLIESLGIVIATIEATMRTDELLRQSQAMAQELQAQQQELQQTNEELEHKAQQLTAQRDEVERKNREVEMAKQELEEKAGQLALTSKYKSQFLANMSHELRTPLNSLLILSKKLAENVEHNLDSRQVQYATTIHQAGSDLLALINEILDLAKVESGTMTVEVREVRFEDLYEYVDGSFRQLAKERGLELFVDIKPELPDVMITDDMRLRQVLRNLLSNAIKFTESGSVTLRAREARPKEWEHGSESLEMADQVICFEVEDTGIGIPEEKQQIIFEAFQQADGGTSRKYAGTGLGLSISRELVRLLGGELSVESEPGVGSTFRLYLPRLYRSAQRTERSSTLDEVAPSNHYAGDHMKMAVDLGTSRPPRDDRNDIGVGDRVVLIVASYESLSRRLVEAGRAAGFKCVLTSEGSDARAMISEVTPDALLIDTALADMDGRVLLDQFKHDPRIRHVPACLVLNESSLQPRPSLRAWSTVQRSADDTELEQVVERLRSFVDRAERRLLVVGADFQVLPDKFGNGDVETVHVPTLAQAACQLEGESFDCVAAPVERLTDDVDRFIAALSAQNRLDRPSMVLFCGDEVEPADSGVLRRLGEHVLLRLTNTAEHLFYEATMLLHRDDQWLTKAGARVIKETSRGGPEFHGKRVLVVDDDVRNIFAITALLEEHGLEVIFAESGEEGLSKLEGVDLVLMDIMMPGMDGYETTRRIRSRSDFSNLPIIALTAKAMMGDREKCLNAGATDYITKPVDAEHLVAMLRVRLAESEWTEQGEVR
ncbi:HAMP domain-containing protein [Persicimonas caeni]|uniref:histidine kinase n=2 Tax=Persicimonas caeni TaxID=2292766 RepID=A0A4Y6Q2M6_PERCE|nr:HAMP domain-containing protein [Persicimonas caeni]QED36038.1 HAMP domain-containing protein [Persicimonas caeni]